MEDTQKSAGLYVPPSMYDFAMKLLAEPTTINNAMDLGAIKDVFVDDALGPCDWYIITNKIPLGEEDGPL